MIDCLIGMEAKLFCLILMGVLFVFQTRNIQAQTNNYKYVYIFSFSGVLLSLFSAAAASNVYMQITFSVLTGLSYALFAYFWCKTAFISEEDETITRNTVFVLVAEAFGIISYFAEHSKTDIFVYTIVFAVILVLMRDLYDKISTDNLTKLYNRYGMEAEIREQLRQYKRANYNSFYLIVCDLDHFKQINDTWGHEAGDKALVLVAKALSKVVKNYKSKVFRTGGDEFVIITDTSELGLADAIEESIKIELGNINFRDDFEINLSMGHVMYDGVTPIEELMKTADKKMYDIKNEGKKKSRKKGKKRNKR